MRPSYMGVKEAAKHLGFSADHLRNLCRAGVIPALKLGPGFTCRWKIDIEKVRAALNIKRDMGVADELARLNPSAGQDEEMKMEELNRRAGKVAAALGPKVVFDLLKSFGADSVGTLHPRHYSAFRHGLLRASMRIKKDFKVGKFKEGEGSN